METTSTAQADAWRDRRAAPPEDVRDGVTTAGIPMGVDHISSSLAYLFRDADGDVHVVDPGMRTEAAWEALTRAILSVTDDLRRVRTIIITHGHLDHAGSAERLREESGAALLVHERDGGVAGTDRGHDRIASAIVRWGVPPDRHAELESLAKVTRPGGVVGDRLLRDGEVITLPGIELEVISTPGHTPGSICLVDRERELLLTGDHLLPTMYGGIGLGDETDENPLAEYHSSLDRIAGLDRYEALPGHGYRFRGIDSRIDQTRRHHTRRSEEVAAALRAEPDATTWQVASHIGWTAGWDKMTGFYLFSALHQTEIHRDYVSGGVATRS